MLHKFNSLFYELLVSQTSGFTHAAFIALIDADYAHVNIHYMQ